MSLELSDLLTYYLSPELSSSIFNFSPDSDPPDDLPAPISYVNLQKWHLPQVHDLLSRMFWDGIDGAFACIVTDQLFLQIMLVYQYLRAMKSQTHLIIHPNGALCSQCTRG
jgi:hypothetical protein